MVKQSDGHGSDRVRGLQRESGKGMQGLAIPLQEIVNAPDHEWTPQARRVLEQIRPRQPVRPDDSVIQGLRAIVVGDRALKSKAFRRDTGCRITPQVHADQRQRLEPPGRLLPDLAHDGGKQRFALLHVAGGLIENETALDALLDDEKTPLALRDGRHGYVRISDAHPINYSNRRRRRG